MRVVEDAVVLSSATRLRRYRTSKLINPVFHRERHELIRLAAAAVATVLRNCIGSVLLLVVVLLALTQGNYLSNYNPAEQSIQNFATGAIAQFCFFQSMPLMFVQATSLNRLQFVVGLIAPRPLLLTERLVRVVRRCWRPWIVWSAIITSSCYAIGSAGSWYITKAKLHGYVALIGWQMFTITTDMAVRTIFQRETEQGRALGHVNTRPYCVRLVRAQLSSPQVFPALMLATSYVHMSSRVPISSTSKSLLVFSICSVALKVALQELAKRFILKRKDVRQRVVFIVVMLPTILVDTQLRVALVRFQSVGTGSSWMAFVALAFIKCIVRVVKVALVRRELLQRYASHTSSLARTNRWVHRVMPRGPAKKDSRPSKRSIDEKVTEYTQQ